MRILGYLLWVAFVTAVLLGQSSVSSVPQISVRSLSIECQICQLSQQEQESIVFAVKRHTYQPDSLQEISQRVRYGFQSHGFFKATVSEPSVALVGPVGANETVDVIVSVKEGEQYRLESIGFTGNTLFSAAELRSQFNLEPGEVFNVDKVRQGLELLRQMYVSKGYTRFTPVPITDVNESKHTISLRIDLEEGQRETVAD